jgi:polar amino acid transport system substrate-binding protein
MLGKIEPCPSEAPEETMNGRRSIQALCGALAFGIVFANASAAQAPTYKVGVTKTGIPFTYLDPKTGTFQGAMIDVLRSIAADAGFDVNLQPMPFATLIPALTANRIDIIGAAMLVTTSRRAAVDFSDPVLPYPEALVVNLTDKTAYRSLVDLKGHVIGVQGDTVYADLLKHSANAAEIKTYPSVADVLREVAQGRVYAGIADAPIVNYQLAQNVSLRARLVPTYEPKLIGNIGIAVRKGDSELLQKINASIAKLRADGTIDKILASWNLE